MIILGIVLLILDFLFKLAVVWAIGIIVLVIGAALALAGFIATKSAADAITTSEPT